MNTPGRYERLRAMNEDTMMHRARGHAGGAAWRDEIFLMALEWLFFQIEL
jgi:hypothetical protein